MFARGFEGWRNLVASQGEEGEFPSPKIYHHPEKDTLHSKACSCESAI